MLEDGGTSLVAFSWLLLPRRFCDVDADWFMLGVCCVEAAESDETEDFEDDDV